MGSRVVVGGLVLGCVVGLLGGCSDDPDPVTPRTPTPAPTTPTSTAAPSPSPTPSVSLPLSALEDDPAVQAIRAHLREFALTINDGGMASQLADTSTADRLDALPPLLSSEAGLEYPGPVPYTPVKLIVDTPDRKDVLGCAYNGGYAVDPTTGEPRIELQNVPSAAVVVKVDGVWKVDGLYSEDIPNPPDCSTVEVQEVSW